MVDGFEIYDSVVHNPTAEEKKILNGITFKEKMNIVTKSMINTFTM